MSVNKLTLEIDGLNVGDSQLVTSGGGVFIGKNLSVQGNIYTGDITGTTRGYVLGYRDIPQIIAANVVLSLSDAGKFYYSNFTSPINLTIPISNITLFPNGTVIDIINRGPGNVNVIPGSLTQIGLYLPGNSVINVSRTIGSNGVARLIKTETDIWFISGFNIS